MIQKYIKIFLHGIMVLWETTDFESREDFATFVRDIFKEPGQYNFDETSKEFNAEATKFTETNVYCVAPFKSRDFIAYWEGEKKKCRKGVIFKSKIKNWYIARDYYMWLNFLPIFNKEIQKGLALLISEMLNIIWHYMKCWQS